VPSADNPEQAHADSFKKRFAANLRHPPESEARLNKWFRDDKFGVFIHFGAYSPLAGQYKGNPMGGPYAEWAMMAFRIPLKEYREEVVSQFNPQEFDADEWARRSAYANNSVTTREGFVTGVSVWCRPWNM
jgi:alpha-L-fucosidase